MYVFNLVDTGTLSNDDFSVRIDSFGSLIDCIWGHSGLDRLGLGCILIGVGS